MSLQDCAKFWRKRKRPAFQPAFCRILDAAKRCQQLALSASRLAAAGNADLFLETVEADGADHDLLADHIARRAVHAHRFGELEVLLDGGPHLGALDVLLDLRGVETGFLGRLHRARLVSRAAAA